MKLRTDFVTNSSSSSFILARKEEFSEKQKVAIINFVEDELLGRKMLSPENSENEIEQVMEGELEYYNENTKEKIRKALEEGKTIYEGYVSYEESDYHLANMYETLWNILKQTGDGNFIAIDDDLSY